MSINKQFDHEGLRRLTCVWYFVASAFANARRPPGISSRCIESDGVGGNFGGNFVFTGESDMGTESEHREWPQEVQASDDEERECIETSDKGSCFAPLPPFMLALALSTRVVDVVDVAGLREREDFLRPRLEGDADLVRRRSLMDFLSAPLGNL